MDGQSLKIHCTIISLIQNLFGHGFGHRNHHHHTEQVMTNKCVHLTFYFYLSRVLGAANEIRLQ